MTEEGQVDEEMKASKPQTVPENPSFTTETSLSSPANPAARRAKIICTIGPACHSEAAMRDLLRLGMDVARLNFSHGPHEKHPRNIERLRRAAQKEGRTVCILQDLQGPKIRTGRLEGHEPVLLKSGSSVIITPRDIACTAHARFHYVSRPCARGQSGNAHSFVRWSDRVARAYGARQGCSLRHFEWRTS